MLEQPYAELRRCGVRRDGTPRIDHRIDGPHECRTVRHRLPPGRPPAGGHRIITATWEEDETWGTLVWLVTVTGMLRAGQGPGV